MLHSLKQMRERLLYVPLTNEAAYRAFYVTPLLFAALDHFRFKMNIEYAISGGWLTGTVAYLLRGRYDLVVAGVKNEELERGQKRVTKDSETYILPRDLERLVGVFAGLLGECESQQDDVKREGARLSWANS